MCGQLVFKNIIEAKPGYLIDFPEGGGEFEVRRVVQPRLHRREDGRAVVEAGADDKRETETREVGGVAALKRGEFLVAHTIQSRARLLARRFGRELVLLREPARQVRVRADE